jgi:hypothetical protein
MTPEEERDYQEALRRIKEAEANNSFDRGDVVLGQ